MKRVFAIFVLLSLLSLSAFAQGSSTGQGTTANQFRPTATPPNPPCPYYREFMNLSNQLALVSCTGAVTIIGSGGGGGGTGTVTSLSVGDLSPLFTSSVTNPTTTPAVSFSLTPVVANTYFGNATGLTATPSYTVAAGLTRTNDTNVTLTLGGNPTVALLNATSITVGWTGTLAASRLNSNVVQGVTNDTNVTGSISAQNLTLGWTGTLAAGRLNSNVVQAVTNDTNVTGSIAAQDLTLGWTGQLAASRGGTGLSTATNNGVIVGNGSAWAASVIPSCSNGTTDKLLYNNSTQAFTCGTDQTAGGGTGITTLNTLTAATQTFAKVDDTNVTLTIGSASTTHTFTMGWTGQLSVARGGTGLASGTSGGIPYFSGTTTIASSGLLTANAPVIGGGAGVAPTVGSRSGNTTTFATTTGTLTNGRLVAIDANGNLVQSAITATTFSPGGTTNSIQINSGGGLFDGGSNALLDLTSSTITLGTSSGQNGRLQLRNATNVNVTNLLPGAPAANIDLTLPIITDTIVSRTTVETLTNKTLTTPTIGDFTNAGHNHTNAAGGGQLTDAALSSAVTLAKGGTGLTSAADDTTLISSGSAWVATAIPNCTDTAGNHINYNTSTNAFSCGNSTSSSGSVSGSGTTGTLSKFTASSTLGDSLISESGSAITGNGKLTLNGITINTDATNTIGGLSVGGNYTKNDTNSRTFATVNIAPSLNFGGSNLNTTVDALKVSVTSTAPTGAIVNLLNLKYGSTPATVFSVDSAGAITFASGVRQAFAPSVSIPSLNIGQVAGDPSSLVNGDMWYDTGTGKFRCRENGTTTNCIPTSLSLTSTQVGFGNGSNLLTGSTSFTWNDSTKLLTIGTGSAGPAMNLAGTGGTSAYRVDSAQHPNAGSAGGMICPNVGSSQSGGCGLWWTDGTYGGTSRLALSLGLNWQGYDTGGQSFKILKSTASSSTGATIFDFRPNDGYVSLAPFGTSAGQTTGIQFVELAANGTNYVQLRAPDAIGSTNPTIVLPSSATPSVNDVLTVTGVSAGILTTAWQAGGATISSVSNSDSSLTISPTTGSVVASLNVGNANTWTALQTISGGTNSGANRLLMTVTARNTNGLRNSSNITWRGSSYDGSAHTIDYIAQSNPTANAGTSSYWSLGTSLDGAAATNITTIQQDGTATFAGGVVAQSGNLVLNDMGISRTSSTLMEVNNTNVGSYLDLKVRQYFADATITAGGTTGDQTINKSLFSVNFATGISFLTVTNSLITTNSLVICTPQKKTTLLTIAAEVHSGSVDLIGNAGASSETKVACIVFNN